MCRSPHAPGSRSFRSAPIAVSCRRANISRYCLTCAGPVYQSAKAPPCQRNRATRSRGRRGAGAEAARDGWWHIEKPRRREQSVRSRARPVIPFGILLLLAHESLFSPLRYLSIPPNGEICISSVIANEWGRHQPSADGPQRSSSF